MKTIATLGLFAALSLQQAQQPLRSGVELVLVDVQVSSRDGTPALNLRPDQFDVRIDDKQRPVVTLDFVRYSEGTQPEAAAGQTPPAAAPADAPPPTPREDRVLILAIDQASFIPSSKFATLEVIKRIAAMADPSDLIGLIAYPEPGVRFSPSHDRKALLEEANKIDGQMQLPTGRVVVSLADAVDWTVDAEFRRNLIIRECGQPGDCRSMNACGCQVQMMAEETVTTFLMQGLRGIAGLHSVVETVRQYPGRKTLVVVSAGLVQADRIGGNLDLRSEAHSLGQRAATANAVIYSLHMDFAFLYAYSAQSAGRIVQGVFRNSGMLASGLDTFTGNAGGTMITVHAGPDAALKRVLSETSAYYLLGVEPLPEHRDGKTHRIQVQVRGARGVEVRSRSSVLIPKGPGL